MKLINFKSTGIKNNINLLLLFELDVISLKNIGLELKSYIFFG